MTTDGTIGGSRIELRGIDCNVIFQNREVKDFADTAKGPVGRDMFLTPDGTQCLDHLAAGNFADQSITQSREDIGEHGIPALVDGPLASEAEPLALEPIACDLPEWGC
ncbi:hypothetical protein A7A09_013500 [Paracoccus methylarcula]|uniref:Uncharacterized protein n=1 Tax=Paracoccus methylarcula TaxID=72022 RepID=A0A3R7LP26_9RHOB|nr:hypothetical protein [Paracoccus methylarcula]RNF33928.1 hypothetical protein A7A09_013500 [Paracoccus methylarcula]